MYSPNIPFPKDLNPDEHISILFEMPARDRPLIEPICRRQADFIAPISEEARDLYIKGRQLEFLRAPVEDADIIALFEEAAKKGNWDAYKRLIRMYLVGQRVEKNNQRALELVLALVDAKHPYGYFVLGQFLHEGEYLIKQDIKKAYAYFDLAYQHGSPQAQAAIGGLYAEAEVAYINEDLNKLNQYLNQSFKYYQCAGEQGHQASLYQLALTTGGSVKNIPKALRYYQKAAMLGHGKSMYAMYSRLKNNNNEGYIPDPDLLKCINDKMELLDENPLLTFPNLETECPLPLHPILGDGSQYPDKRRELGFMQRVKSFGYPTNDPND
ncbi:hypothetical protein AwWohl_14460 [Gammaproteobacteria bacterium]|nr:hypothetical protein AwWohl_14460 [Gammaproteobacteria bacterium]